MVEIYVRRDPEAVFSWRVLYLYFIGGCGEYSDITEGAVEATVIGRIASFRRFWALALLLAARVGGLSCCGLCRHASCGYDPWRGHVFDPVEEDAEG